MGWWLIAVGLTGCIERIEPPEDGKGGQKLSEGERLQLQWHAVETSDHPGCERGVAAYDSARGELVYLTTPPSYLTGDPVRGSCNETWVYDGVDWREAQPVGPTPRSDPAFGYDPVRERVVMFGGQTHSGDDTRMSLSNQVWEWDGAIWTNRTPPASALQPEPMYGAGLTFDPVSGQMILFSGAAATTYPKKTWSWDGTSFTLLATEGPEVMRRVAYDGDGHLIGLGSAGGSHPSEGVYRPSTSVTWSWDGSAWSSTPIDAFVAYWAVYDPTADAALFGSSWSSVGYLGTDGVIPLAVSGDPPPTEIGFLSSGAYDSARDRTVVWAPEYGHVVMELDAWTVQNQPPEFVDPPDAWSLQAGYRSVLALQVTESDGDPLELFVEGVPDQGEGGVEITKYPGAYVVSWTPSMDEVGSHEAVFTLSDGYDEQTITVPITVTLRDLPGYPHGVWDGTGTGTAETEITSCGYRAGTASMPVSCSLHVENPGFVDISCSADVPYWTAQGCGSMGGIALDRDNTASLWGTHRMSGDAYGSFRMESGGYSQTSGFIYPAISLWGSVYPVDGGYQVEAWAELDDWTRYTATDTHTPAIFSIPMPTSDAPPLTVSELGPGDLVVTEVMRDPKVVSDSKGEWFELVNRSGSSVDLEGLVISDLDADLRVLTGSLVIEPDGFVVIGRLADSMLNGGVTVDYAAGSAMQLANGADEIVIGNGLVTIDSFVWGATGLPWVSGASLSLSADAVDNDDASAWCAATSSYGVGDLGTPGLINPGC